VDIAELPAIQRGWLFFEHTEAEILEDRYSLDSGITPARR
jgi:hypothetical protein